MAFKSILLVVASMAVLVIARAYPQGDSEVFRAYSPGQYVNDGQQQIIRTAPRLVAVRHGGGGVVRAIPAGALKRVRVAPAPVQQNYAVEQPLAVAPQQTYYVQRQPLQAKPAHVVKPIAAARPAYQQSQEEEEEYASDPNPQYNFSFDVKDDDLTNYQNRQEERDGGVIKGSYSVVDPDGYVRTVTYTADPKNGFQAKVVREPTDVKVKFPVPTQAPEDQQSLYRAAKPSQRQTQITQFPAPRQPQYEQPQYQQQYQPQQQPAVYQQYQGQPTYVVRRLHHAGSSSIHQPRVVKVLRAQ